MTQSFYDDLKVGRQADRVEMRQAYLRLAVDWHPERWQERDPELAEAMFTGVARAFSVLSDPEQRARYDAWLDAQQTERPEDAAPDREAVEAPSAASQWNGSLTRSAADEIFSRQMLYFAAGLSAGGMSAGEVTQYLAAFGCPRSLAAMLGKSARSLGASDPTGQAGRASTDARNRQSLDGIPWPQAEPYFISYLSGTPEPERIDDEAFARLARGTRIRDTIALIIAITLLALLLLVHSLAPSRQLLAAALGAGMLATIAAWMLGTLSSARRHPTLRGEQAIRKYLPDCRDIAEGRGGHYSVSALVWGPAWAALHRMPWLASAWLVSLGGTAVAASVNGFPLSWVASAHLVLSVAFGAVAARLLIAKARRTIEKHMQLGWSDASRRIAGRGGVNRWAAGSVVAFALAIAIAVAPPPEPQGATAEPSRNHPRTGSGESRAVDDDPSIRAGEEAQTRAQEATNRVEALREFNRLKAAYEAQYPELNPNAKQYDAALARRIEDRVRSLEAGGAPAPEALNRAIDEYVRESLARPRSAQPDRAAARETAPGSRPDPEREAPAESDPLKTICETFPHACRK